MSQSLADAKSPNLPPAVFLQHFRSVREAKRIHDEAGMALARVKKAAKNVGIDLSALKLVEQMRKLDDDEAEIVVRHAFEYAAWLGTPLGTQAALFPDVTMTVEAKAQGEQLEWEAGEAGYLAGKGGKLRDDNPFPLESPLYVAWDKAWIRGLKINAAELRAKEDLKSDKASDKKAAITKLSDVKPGDIPGAPRGRGRPPKSSNGDATAPH
jgi:hypothetical protein